MLDLQERIVLDNLSKYPNAVQEKIAKRQVGFWWVSYLLLAVFICMKIMCITLLISFTKLFDICSDIRISSLFKLVISAEFVFLIAIAIKFSHFYWSHIDFTIKDFQSYYPLSLLNYQTSISSEKLMTYPLQLVNLFELFYWGILAYGIYELSDQKVKPVKAFGLVAMTYGVGLMFWVGVVSFLILNSQY